MYPATSDPVFIVDDDPAARESVAAVVRSHGMEAETYDSGEDFLSRFDRRRNGCLVVDMRMTGMSGIELQQHLVETGIELPVIMITGYGDVPTAVRAMRSGALTFLEKPCNDQVLWDSICQALEHQARLREQSAARGIIRRKLATLTLDEHGVLEKLMDGRPNKSIAKELDLGLRTVELRRANILQKMQAASLAELVRMVMLAGGIRHKIGPAVDADDDSQEATQRQSAEGVSGGATSV